MFKEAVVTHFPGYSDMMVELHTYLPYMNLLLVVNQFPQPVFFIPVHLKEKQDTLVNIITFSHLKGLLMKGSISILN